MKAFIFSRYHALRTTDNHWLRKSVGVALVIGGCLGFLPVLGYWMLPLGLALLAVDFPYARRLNRRLMVWWGRQMQRVNGGRGNGRVAATQRATRSPGRRSGP